MGLKKTKPVLRPRSSVTHSFELFLPLHDRCRGAPVALDQPHWRSFHGKNKGLILKQNDDQSGLVFEYNKVQTFN